MKSGSLILTSAVCGLVALACGCNKGSDKSAATQTPSAPPASVQPAPTFAPLSQPESKDMEAVLVTVNGKSLTRAMSMRMAQEMAARQGVPPQMLEQFLAQMGERMEQQAIEQFISQALIQKEAERQEIPVSDEEVDAVIARLSETLPEGMTLEQALAAQNLALEDLRKDITGNERMRKLYEAQTASVEAPTDEEVSSFYDENSDRFKTEESVETSHILIACDESADEAAHAKAKAEAEALRVEIEEGADFAELAMAHSSCPSKDRGGSLGANPRGRMVKEFDDAAFSQEVGMVGPVVKTQFGYHLIKVDAKEEGGMRSLEESSEEIRAYLEAQSKEQLFSTFLDGLREGAEITYGEGVSAGS
ncbi:MAG: peptidylprolyl isomerase [Lentisphaerae bacterium]|nr:peptidylprolyl isomerase [Lentisphaerota bacterium]